MPAVHKASERKSYEKFMEAQRYLTLAYSYNNLFIIISCLLYTMKSSTTLIPRTSFAVGLKQSNSDANEITFIPYLSMIP